MAFAAQGASQFGNFSEAFVLARVAVYDALKVMNRKPGAPKETIYSESDDGESSERKVKAVLPKYEIDSASSSGRKPMHVHGHLSFKNVVFSYPTRPNENVLNSLSTEILPGQTVAFVGPRYGIAALDPLSLTFRTFAHYSFAVEVEKALWWRC
jgi:ABC-type multidrug transport system fused ATPase/permease subunit